MDKFDIKIFVVTHKDVDLSELKLDSIYNKLLVGAKTSNDENILLDSTGENISHKNKYYCELTGLYWIWKNIKCGYVGLCHYRRYLKEGKSILNKNQIKEIFEKKDVDIILPIEYFTFSSVYDEYKEHHIISDLELCENIIRNDYPDYIESYNKVMKGHSTYICNMFISKKEIIDQYCLWLFDILSKVEQEIDLNQRDDYQKRVFGFLSERLFTVWIDKNKLKVYKCKMENTECKTINKLKGKVKKNLVKLYLKIIKK